MGIWHPRAWWGEWRRRRLVDRVAPGVLREYLGHPFPRGDTPWREVEYLALDLETTGLDPARERILSVGFVPVRGGGIILREGRRLLVRPERPVPRATAVIHGILDDQASQGVSEAEMLERVLPALAGRVLVGHYVRMERAFLEAACRRVFGYPLPFLAVDTLVLAQRTQRRRHQVVQRGALRLAALREAHQLPRYKAHDALWDAIAAGELFLAQVAQWGGGEAVRLEELLG